MELEQKLRLEYEERLKQQIYKEEEEKDREANEQALKKGGKAVGKKDPKKQ